MLALKSRLCTSRQTQFRAHNKTLNEIINSRKNATENFLSCPRNETSRLANKREKYDWSWLETGFAAESFLFASVVLPLNDRRFFHVEYIQIRFRRYIFFNERERVYRKAFWRREFISYLARSETTTNLRSHPRFLASSPSFSWLSALSRKSISTACCSPFPLPSHSLSPVLSQMSSVSLFLSRSPPIARQTTLARFPSGHDKPGDAPFLRKTRSSTGIAARLKGQFRNFHSTASRSSLFSLREIGDRAATLTSAFVQLRAQDAVDSNYPEIPFACDTRVSYTAGFRTRLRVTFNVAPELDWIRVIEKNT